MPLFGCVCTRATFALHYHAVEGPPSPGRPFAARNRMTNPPCPITGEPAVRHVQSVSARLLADLWRYTPFFRVNARPSFWSCGALRSVGVADRHVFFEPRLEGDGEFYPTFYKHINMPKRLRVRGKGWRREFDMASERVRPGDRVLDVGCGFASFRTVVPQANYTGLDPNFREHDPLARSRPKPRRSSPRSIRIVRRRVRVPGGGTSC